MLAFSASLKLAIIIEGRNRKGKTKKNIKRKKGVQQRVRALHEIKTAMHFNFWGGKEQQR